jgi:hypothetical protein
LSLASIREIWRPYAKAEQQRQVESGVNQTMEDECFFGRYYAASSKKTFCVWSLFALVLETASVLLGDTAMRTSLSRATLLNGQGPAKSGHGLRLVAGRNLSESDAQRHNSGDAK